MTAFNPLHWGEPHELDAQARAQAPGQFVELSDGLVHYQLAGPADGQPLVLIHGFSIPSYIWDPTFEPLARAGLRVLRYDLYGRGYSARPHQDYDLALFDRQLLDLLDALGVRGPVDLVGLSMGGVVAVAFSARYPERVRKLILIDPAGMPRKQPLTLKLVQVPLLGELLIGLFGDRVFLSELSTGFYRPGPFFPDFRAQFLPQTGYRGFKRALLSSLRSDVLDEQTALYRRVGEQGRPVLLIWGRHDQVIPFNLHQKVQQAIPQLAFHPIEEAGHTPHYERPEAVNPILIDFLTR